MATTATAKEARRAKADKPARERLEARVTPEVKRLLERAAALEGRTLTDFVVGSAHRAAVETIQAREVIRLNEEQSRRFVQALLNPPEPTDYMRESYRRSRELFGE